MGNNITVKNETSNEIICRVYPAGLEEKVIEDRVPVNSTKVFSFGFKRDKTYIVSIAGKATRAISKSKIACLKEIKGNDIVIVVEESGTGVSASAKKIIESYEMNLNWNAVRDTGVKNEDKKITEESLALLTDLNKHVATVFGMLTGFMVAETSGSKDAARLATKMSSDFFNSYLKASIPRLKRTEDATVIFELNKIRQTLVAISREVLFGYGFFRDLVNDNKELKLKYLHDHLLRMTSSNIFPFLEECCLEICAPIYVFAISIILDLFSKIREITESGPCLEELKYTRVFVSNLKVMWDSVLENVKDNSKVKMRGCLVKKATLTYQGELVYQVQSICGRVVRLRIEDIKKEFIENRIYQMEFLYDRPSEFVRKYEEQFDGNL